MNDRSLSQTSVATLWNRHRGAISASVVVCVMVAGAVTPLLPKSYAAHMEVLVRNERDQYLISPNQTAAAPAPAAVSEEQVNSELELMQSQDLLEKLVLDAQLYKGPFHDGVPSDSKLLERTIVKLRNDLDVSAIRKTNIIRVSVKAGRPEWASSLLNDLLRQYMTAEVSAHGSPKSYKFFSEQLTRDSAKLQEASTSVSEFRQQTQLFDAEQQRIALVAQLAGVSSRMMDTESEIAEQKSRQQATEAERSHADPRMATQIKSVVNQALVERLQGELADLENKKIDLLVKYKSDDRMVLSISEQITNLHRQLASALTSPTEEKQSDTNPLHVSLVGDLSRGRIGLTSLAARHTALLTERADYLAQLNKLDRNTVQLKDLARVEQDAERNYAATERQVEEARVSEQMDQQQIVNVAVIERPVASPLPVSPSLKFNLALGAFLGLLIGFLWSYLQEGKVGEITQEQEHAAASEDRAHASSVLV